MKLLSALTLASIVVIPNLGLAEHRGRSPYQSGPSMYIFGGASAVEHDYDSSNFRYSFGDGSLSDIDTDNETGGLRLGLGFGFSPELALEMGFVDLGSITGTGFSDGSQLLTNGYTAGRVDMDGDVDGVFLGIKVHTPEREPMGLYARFGVYAWEFAGTVQDNSQGGKFSVEGTDPYVGVGLRFAVAENADLQIGYDHYVLDDDESVDMSANTLSADLVLRF
ncbi:MAG: outer membrane beta-barrel protein [Zhongshania sp.]|uniref:outer membrane beta-barrel protein n=1 Tax=Zhongshania sp. TaxID=1971902 RepID=UPI00260FC501|nr:outer membrane beta-barrel protein [Zhongshania sp.]MDF1693457.1 outer membrane beta-barrel protein [Zhongshania sp.]